MTNELEYIKEVITRTLKVFNITASFVKASKGSYIAELDFSVKSDEEIDLFEQEKDRINDKAFGYAYIKDKKNKTISVVSFIANQPFYIKDALNQNNLEALQLIVGIDTNNNIVIRNLNNILLVGAVSTGKTNFVLSAIEALNKSANKDDIEYVLSGGYGLEKDEILKQKINYCYEALQERIKHNGKNTPMIFSFYYSMLLLLEEEEYINKVHEIIKKGSKYSIFSFVSTHGKLHLLLPKEILNLFDMKIVFTVPHKEVSDKVIGTEEAYYLFQKGLCIFKDDTEQKTHILLTPLSTNTDISDFQSKNVKSFEDSFHSNLHNEKYIQAKELLKEKKEITINDLMRALLLGYNDAEKIMHQLLEEGLLEYNTDNKNYIVKHK